MVTQVCVTCKSKDNILKKSTIANSIAQKYDFSEKKVLDVIDTMLEIITESLVEGDSVAISGFGSFVLEKRKSKTLFLPGTKQKVLVKEKKIVKFRPSKKLKEQIATICD